MGSIVTWFRRLFHHISCLASSLPSLLFLGYNIAVLTSIPLLLPPPLSPLPPPFSPSLPPCFNLYDVKLNCIFFYFFLLCNLFIYLTRLFSAFILFYFILFYFIYLFYFFLFLNWSHERSVYLSYCYYFFLPFCSFIPSFLSFFLSFIYSHIFYLL